MTRAALVLAVLFGLAAADASPPGEGWRTFEGSWSAAGRREVLPTEGGRPAATIRLSGSVVLTSAEGLSRGFVAEAIGFDDGGETRVGRAVWTDDRGDRVYSSLRGEPLATGRRMTGTITGGTGRYAGLTGDYAFTWQFVVLADDGTLQGFAPDLKGRQRRGAAPP